MENFFRIAMPLTRLTREDIKFIRDDSCKESFMELKQKLTIAPMLIIPSSELPYVV